MGTSRPRVAVFGVGHWHAPLYLEPLSRLFQLTLVQDSDARVADDVATRFDAVRIDSAASVTRADVDVAVVLGRHDEMHRVGMQLVEEGIPFLIEKPAGRSLTELTALSKSAAEHGVPVTVPMVHRWGPVARALRAVRVPRYFSTTYIVGPPERYIDSGNAWMLSIDSAGGGPLVNIGVHFVDLFLQLTGERDAVVKASMQRSMHGLDIEDHATVLLETLRGSSAVLEVGYDFPSSEAKRFARFSLAGDDGFVSVGPDGRQTTTRTDGSRVEEWVDVDSDPLFAAFLELFAGGLEDGFAGLPTLDELVMAMTLIERAYVDAGISAGTGATWAS